MPYSVPSTGVKTVPAICDRVSQSFCWISSLMRTQSHVFVCFCTHSNQHQLQLFKIPFSPSSLNFFASNPSANSPLFLPSPLLSSPHPPGRTVSCSSPSFQQRFRSCSGWWSSLRSSTSARSNLSTRATPTPRSPFTTRYGAALVLPTAALPPVTCSVSSCSLVWAQSLEGAHADGAAGGE